MPFFASHSWLINFSKVMFTDECRATLDGPDSLSSGWVHNELGPKSRKRRQQGGGGVLFWALIVDDEVLGPVRVPQRVKLDSKHYCELLKSSLISWLEEKDENVRKSLIFMHDTAPSHVVVVVVFTLHPVGPGPPLPPCPSLLAPETPLPSADPSIVIQLLALWACCRS